MIYDHTIVSNNYTNLCYLHTAPVMSENLLPGQPGRLQGCAPQHIANCYSLDKAWSHITYGENLHKTSHGLPQQTM